MHSHPTTAARAVSRCPRGTARSALAALVLLGFAIDACAQSPSVEFESRQKLDPTPATPLPLVDRKALAAPVTGIDRIVIRSFRFSGAQSITPETLASELASFIGRELTAADLHRAASDIARLYLRRGGMARVKVKAVSLAEGTAEIEIQELRIGQVRVELPSDTRITPELIERFVTVGLAPGEPVPLAQLEDGVSMFNAEPGIAAAIGIDAGAKPDEVDITLRVQDRPVFSGRISLDNHGLREIGQDRLDLSLRASNAFGLAERFALGLEQTAGSTLLAPAFSIALPKPGMRLGLEATDASYEARRGGAALELKGEFLRWRAVLQHRARYASGLALNVDYSLWRIIYHDDSIVGELRRRRISGASVRLAGIARTEAGLSRASIEVERGRADLSANAADFATDAASAKVDGNFWLLRWRLGHELALGQGTLALRVNGQWADRNLDATQQFALGGVSQVRAFPTAEALGDEGWIATIEWRQPLGADVDGRLFVDGGGITRNARPWVNQVNRYDLSGIGAGLSWRMPENFRFTTDIARQWGGNAGRNADDTDSDGRDSRWRLWLALSRDF
jgi:hemolysin activation/secretion protein